ncbi:MAG: hypothetical protein WBA57_27045 [Elainellaceae cyanobacterium]
MLFNLAQKLLMFTEWRSPHQDERAKPTGAYLDWVTRAGLPRLSD